MCVCICFSPRDDLMGERYRTRRCKGRRSIDRKRKQTITFFFRRARERERENIVPLLLRGTILTCRFFLSLSLSTCVCYLYWSIQTTIYFLLPFVKTTSSRFRAFQLCERFFSLSLSSISVTKDRPVI